MMLYFAGAITLFTLLPVLTDSLRRDVREISFQDFVNGPFAYGRVHHLQVINQRFVRVFLRGDTAPSDPVGAAGSAGGNDGLLPAHGAPDGSAAVQRGGEGSSAVYWFSIGSVDSFERKMQELQTSYGIEVKDHLPILYTNEFSVLTELAKLAPTLIILGLIYYSMTNMMGSMGPGGPGGPGNIFRVGQIKPTIIKGDMKNKISFKDIAGLTEAKVEVMEFVEFLKNPEQFRKIGAKIPKGALLCGPPGTGKTLMAKAMAGEASVPFLSISGSDFIEMFVGVGASRVRDLFSQARANAPCIVFIDEIDAVGRARGKGGMGGNDERENTLNQLLVEMDGFNPLTGIVVMAGTNRVDILDPALLRPGRFDRQISIDKPDIKGRYEIYKVHLANLTLADDIDEIAKRMATLTPGFAGADIANVCNEAALIAARHKKTAVDIGDFESAIERVIAGIEKKGKILTPEERTCVAFHEAGHAICGWFLEHADPLLKVSIVPRGTAALGYNQFLPKELALHSREQLFDMICMALGGRVAEELTFGRITTGASDDLDRVTKIAYSQVSVYGMNERVGALSFQDKGGGQNFTKPYSEATAQMMDEEARLIVKNAYERTRNLLTEKKDQLKLLAERLLEKEILTHDDVVALLGPRPFEMNATYKEYIDTQHQWKSKLEAAAAATAAGATEATAAATEVPTPEAGGTVERPPSPEEGPK
mmetsp:Transcript_23490/g.56323  ORF Transcript_23490/g.56323 Transcript_23490/m.56323 type:complete len:707 (+) Transcript_23490:37-2157(+)